MLKNIAETWRRFTHRQPARIEFDDVGVTRVMPYGDDEYVRWHELEAVAIITTDEGPFAEDVFWMLHGPDDRGVAIPGGLMGAALLQRLQALPGFDNQAVIEAMGCAQDAAFLCWRRTRA